MHTEGGHRVPMIVRWPGRIEPGSVCSVPVSGVDFLPTFCELASVELPEDRVIDGASQIPLWAGHEDKCEAKRLGFAVMLPARTNPLFVDQHPAYKRNDNCETSSTFYIRRDVVDLVLGIAASCCRYTAQHCRHLLRRHGLGRYRLLWQSDHPHSTLGHNG